MSRFYVAIDPDRSNPYNRIFVDTDNFGSSYLEELEAGYPKLKTDSLKYAALNDLAYYTHTRDLNKALEFTRSGLKMVREKENTLWEGRFQITEGAILLRMEQLDTAFTILQDAKGKGSLPVPLGLRNAPTSLMKELRVILTRQSWNWAH